MLNAKLRRAGGMTVVTASLLFSGSVLACQAPAMPEVPDGSQATKEHMVQAQSAVKMYMGDANNYLACLDEAINGSVRKSEKMELNRAYNRAVDQMNEIADAFNSALKKFKSA
jgi:hypothetical protein